MSDPRYSPGIGPGGTADPVTTNLQYVVQAINRITQQLGTFLSGTTIAMVGTTAQKTALTNPPTGMLFYDTTLNHLQTNTGTPGSPVWSNP
jgi:hypothetical protein